MELFNLVKIRSHIISSKVHRVRHLSAEFTNRNGMKKGDAYSTSLLIFALGHSRKLGGNGIERDTLASALCC